MKIHFQRQELYSQVWSIPLSKLGPEYGISDNGLRNVCKAMNIPVPSRGYWARREAGQVVETVPLPTNADAVEYTAEVPRQPRSEDDLPADRAWLEEKIAREADPKFAIRFTPTPTQWHPLVQPSRKWLMEAMEAREKRLAAAHREVVRGRKAVVHPQVIQQPLLARDDGLFRDRVGTSCLRVSHLTCARALAVVNALLFAAEQRGCTTGMDEKAGRFELRLEDAVLRFAVRERQEAQEERGRSVHRPTDRIALILEVVGCPGQYEILDRQGVPVESRLEKVFPRLYKAVIVGRVQARKAAAQKERSAAYWEWHKTEEARRKSEDDASLRAKAREAELIDEAHRWRNAVLVREYVAALIERAGDQGVGNESLFEWRQWALKIGSDLDPIESRLKILLSARS